MALRTEAHRPVAVPVLAYHGNNIADNSYSGNDHVALREDLVALHAAGWRPASLDLLLDWHEGRVHEAALRDRFVIPFDDGSDFDFHDIDHPSCGPQRSLFNVLRDFFHGYGVLVPAHAFVIASPSARRQLDERSLVGRGWWNDDWWAAANASGQLFIESHGWDHLHPVLDSVAQREGLAGDFRHVNSFEDADVQFRKSAELIAQRAGGRRPHFFAYPWGQTNDFLLSTYLPQRRSEHGYRAALTTAGEAVTRAHDRWRLPRLVCGEAWRSAEELLSLLNSATR